MFTNIKSFNFISNLGLVLILLLITSAILPPILCQSKNGAIVSNIFQDGKFDRILFEQFTNLLHNDADINVVIIIDEFNKLKSDEELNRLEAALENLNKPFKLLDRNSEKDDKKHLSGMFNNFFESDEVVWTDMDRMFIVLNSKIPNFPNYGFIKVEALNKISEETDLTKIKNVFIISNQSINQIQNYKYLLRMLKEKNIFWVHTSDKKFSSKVNSLNNLIEIELPVTNSLELFDFYLIEQKSDSIYFIHKKLSTNSSDILLAIALNDVSNINIPDDTLAIDTSLSIVFENNFNSSSKTLLMTSENRIYTLLDNGLLYLNNYKGKEIFVTELIGKINNNPVLYKDLFLASTFEGDLYSINSNNGEVLQVVGIGEDITSDLAIIEIATAASKTIGVVLGTSEGNIFCYDAFTFELLWQKNISTNSIISTPLVINDKVIFLSSNSSLYCVNSKSGSLIWKYESSDTQNFSANNFPVSDGKNILSLSSDGKLFAIDILLGKIIWSSNTKGVLNQLYISTNKQNLFLIDDKGMMTVYSSKNGKEISKIDFKKSELFSFILAENQKNTLVGFSDGSLFTFDLKFVSKELISANQIPITSLNVIGKNGFIVKDINGKITFYKIN